MSFNGSGTFLINSTGQPVVANTVISATVFNALTADLASGLTNCITKDGQSTPTANIPMGSNKITGLANGTLINDAATLGQVQTTAAKLITSVSGVDTVTGIMSPTLTAYAAGQLFYFVAAGANTGAVTLNIDGLGAKAVTRDGASALAAGDIHSGEMVVVIYDGTRFQMINAANSFGNTTINGTLTVTGNTGLQANVSITSTLSVGGTFAVTGAATLGSTLAVTGKSDLPTVSTASVNAAVAAITTATVTNLTATSASVASVNAGVALLTTATVTNLTASGASIASANIGNLQFTAASIASINAGVAVVTNLTATSASIASANVGTAVVTTGTVTNLTSTSASIASANAAVALVTTGTVTNLTSTAASIASANLGTAVVTTGTVTNLTATSASIASANAGAAVVTNLTATGASIASANVGTGVVTALTVTGASIASANVGTGVITTLTATGASIASLNAGTATITTGNLTFSSTGQRITGDFTNSTASSRLLFQSSTTNGLTTVGIIPNGTSTTAAFVVNNASDASNASFLQLLAVAAETRINSSYVGTGSYLPLAIYTGGSERMRLDTSGNLGLATATVSTNFRQEIVGAAGSNTGPASSGTTQNASAVMRIRPGGGFTATLDIGQGGGTGSWLQSTDTSNLATTYPLLLNPVGGNVGIGTASPTNKLHLYGSGQTLRIEQNPSAAGNSLVYADAAGASNYAGIRLSGGWMAVRTDFGDEIQFGPDATRANAKMLINVTTGNVGIGGTAAAYEKISVSGTYPTSSNVSQGFVSKATIPSGATSSFVGYYSVPSTQAAAFTCTSLYHFLAGFGTKGASSAITSQYGFLAGSDLTGATNNYGFYSDIASGSNRWNFYAAGTAQNYFAGDVGIGRTPAASTRLTIKGQNNGSGNFSVYIENSTPTELFKIRDDGTFYTGLAGNSPYNLTTSSAANAFVDSDGILRRSTSSLRYKSDVADADHGLSDVLKLRSVTYRGKNDGDKTFGGLIAEEVHDAGLTEFVAYDKEGRPDALHYGNMVALLVKAIQELEAKVAALEAK